MENYLPWLVLIILFIATLGTILPILPGLPIMAAVIILYAFWEGFQNIGAAVLVVTIILTALGSLLDYFSGPWTAKKTGAGKWGVLGALLGGIFGVLVLGPLGLVIGPFIGAFLGEIISGNKLQHASKVGFASMLGTIIGSLLKFIFALIILVLYIRAIL